MINIKIRRSFIFALIISILCLILIYIPSGFEDSTVTNNTLQEKAKVINVNNSSIEVHGLVSTGVQDVEVEILSGKFKSERLNTTNVLSGEKRRDKMFVKGDKALLNLRTDDSGDTIESSRLNDIYRLTATKVLFGIFSVFLILFAGWTGFKAFLSFIFTALCIWKLVIPLFIMGFNPYLVSLLTMLFTTSIIILLVAGFTKKGLIALLGSMAGIVVTASLSVFFGGIFQIQGEIMEFSETLMYAGFQDINFSAIFLSCIFISSTGAVMDIAMDIAASQDEIKDKKPQIKRRDLIMSGFKIARPIIGTMTTTLLFAYSGSFMVVFMSFMAKGIPLEVVLNTNYISAEILNVLVGSFGLVLVAPLTAIIGGYLFSIE